MEAVSRGFFGVPFAADPFGREALAPARAAASPRAALTAAAPSHAHALGAADVKMTAEGITFHVDVPGVRKEALTVEVDPDDRVLTIAGSRAEALAPSADDKQEGEAKEGEGEEDAKQAASAVVRVERAASFVRRFALPPTADIDAITSSLSHGVLTVMVPAAAEPEKPAVRKIEVAAE
jgi:HSP20 family protein